MVLMVVFVFVEWYQVLYVDWFVMVVYWQDDGFVVVVVVVQVEVYWWCVFVEFQCCCGVCVGEDWIVDIGVVVVDQYKVFFYFVGGDQ